MEEFDSGDYNDKFSLFYTYIKTLGKGSYGKVVKAIDRYTGVTCAVKIIKKSSYSDEAVSELRYESEILSRLNHPNIVKFLHVRESENRIFIGMEYIRGGNLADLIQNKNISESKAARIMTGIFRAVEYLHNHAIIHRDLKPANILIANPQDLTTVKVADFGLCTQLGVHSRTDEQCGTVIYMAPEQAAHKNYNKEVDIWSCGIILYKLLCKGKHPLYKQKDNKASYFAKLQHPTWSFPKGFSALAQNLFLKLMKILPIERYTASQVLAHPWILGKNIAIPMTYLEKMRNLDSDIKLRGVVYSLLFASMVIPKEERPHRVHQHTVFGDKRGDSNKDINSMIRRFSHAEELRSKLVSPKGRTIKNARTKISSRGGNRPITPTLRLHKIRTYNSP